MLELGYIHNSKEEDMMIVFKHRMRKDERENGDGTSVIWGGGSLETKDFIRQRSGEWELGKLKHRLN